MKNELINEYRQNVLLSTLDLNNNDFNESWLNGFFLNPIIKDLFLYDHNEKLRQYNIFINFNEFEINKPKKEEDFKLLNKKIKEHIFNDWGIEKKKVYPIYDYFLIKTESKDKVKVIFIFLSPNKSTKFFDFNSISNKNKLTENILSILVKANYLEKINSNVPFDIDICSGKLFLSPQIQETKNNNFFVNIFSYKLNFFNFNLGFNIKNEHYHLESNEDFKNYEDICSIKNFKYSYKADSRKYGRVFIDFHDFDKLKKSKFIVQLELYKNIIQTLDKFNINYKQQRFSPQFLHHNFLSFKNNIKELNIYILEEDKKNYEIMLKDIGVENGFNDLITYIEHNLFIKTNLIFNPTLTKILQMKQIPILYLMCGNQYDENYVKYKKEDSVQSWSNPLNAFIDKEMYKLNEDDFLLLIKNFDIYSQIKLYNIYANFYKKESIMSQGLILDKDILFKKPIKANASKVDNSLIKKKEKEYPTNGTRSILTKILNELYIKMDLYFNKFFVLDINFNEIDRIANFDTIEVLQFLPQNNHKLYSYLKLSKEIEEANKGVFNVTSHQFIMDENINQLNSIINLKEEFKNATNLIIIDNKYLIKIKDNNFMPFLILQESNFNDSNKDPGLLCEYNILKQLASRVSRTAKSNDNLFYPYLLPSIGTLLNKKIKLPNSYAHCLIDLNKPKELVMFMSFGTPVNTTISKNNRLEQLSISLISDFENKAVEWVDYQQIMYFYLSTLTFNLLNINELSKKSLLTKLSDIILVN